MSPGPQRAKKKRKRKQPAPKRAVPVPAVAVPVPAPVLTEQEQRFWKVISTKNLIGGSMFLIGAGFCVGFWFSDRAHGIEKFVLGVGVLLMIFGAHLMSSEPTERALSALARTAVKVNPLARRNGDTKEQSATSGGAG